MLQHSGRQYNLEMIDHIDCRNMSLGLINNFFEPELSARPTNTEWLGIKLNLFIQNGKIVYKAPAEDYIELSWIDKLIATKIEDVYAKQSQDDSIHEKGMGSIYNVIVIFAVIAAAMSFNKSYSFSVLKMFFYIEKQYFCRLRWRFGIFFLPLHFENNYF
jgi:hypothetical protein